MNTSHIALGLIASLLAASALTRAAEPTSVKIINIVVVTGGHDYDKKAFPPLFEGHEGLQAEIKNQKDDSELFDDISNWKYDVIVFYNMGAKINEQRQQNLLKLLDRGVGIVALHHCLAAYPNWDEWAQIIGGKFFLKDTSFAGKQYKQSTYLHDVKVPVRVMDPEHPVTRGMKDFTILDETYHGQWVDPAAKILLTTTEKTSDTATAWCKTYRNARVVTIQHGHGPNYDDPNYRQLIWNAIRWTAAGNK